MVSEMWVPREYSVTGPRAAAWQDFAQQTEKEKVVNTIGSITAYALSIQGELTETFFLAQGDWESPYVKGKQGLYK